MTTHPHEKTAQVIRHRVEQGGERLWRIKDFEDLPSHAVARSLSRLFQAGVLERIHKGVYYKPHTTTFGKSSPNPSTVRKLIPQKTKFFPAGVAAANLLQLSTQTASRGEVATTRLSLPQKLLGLDVKVHSRRPEVWSRLSETDAAFLDFLRRRGIFSELSTEETSRRILALAAEDNRFERLMKVSDSEPPRVRAMLGAIGEQLGKSERDLKKLKSSLNPLSCFDFGMLSGLAYAEKWQANKLPKH